MTTQTQDKRALRAAEKILDCEQIDSLVIGQDGMRAIENIIAAEYADVWGALEYYAKHEEAMKEVDPLRICYAQRALGDA